MTPIAWAIDNSLLADERFRNLTVSPDIEGFTLDYDVIHNEWSNHVDSWFKGDCKLESIPGFLVSRAIAQIVKKVVGEMK